MQYRKIDLSWWRCICGTWRAVAFVRAFFFYCLHIIEICHIFTPCSKLFKFLFTTNTFNLVVINHSLDKNKALIPPPQPRRLRLCSSAVQGRLNGRHGRPILFRRPSPSGKRSINAGMGTRACSVRIGSEGRAAGKDRLLTKTRQDKKVRIHLRESQDRGGQRFDRPAVGMTGWAVGMTRKFSMQLKRWVDTPDNKLMRLFCACYAVELGNQDSTEILNRTPKHYQAELNWGG